MSNVWGDPPDNEDPRDDSERWEEAFKLMEDERAEFEATFRDLGFSMIRGIAHVSGPGCSAHCDYLSYATGCAWTGWLQHARITWVPSPVTISGNYIENSPSHGYMAKS